MEKQTINFHGMQCKAVNYKGVQIINNCLNGGWMLFFDKNGKFKNNNPFAGALSEMKGIVNDAIKIGLGGEKELLKADTYK